MNIWRINVRDQSLKIEETPAHWEQLGGRGLLAQILVDELEATCDPLGPENKLIFAPGLLVGHMLSSCDRISVGGKSPLTGGIKESNAGGRTGLHMTQLGMKALILEDQPQGDEWWVLHLSAAAARWDSAAAFAGMGVYEAAPALLEKYGDRVAIALIGPGGEMQMTAAGIQNIDKDERPSRINARGGMGAVMGSKGLKAIVFDKFQGTRPPIVDKDAFKKAQRTYNRELMNHPQTQSYSEYGTAAMTLMCNAFGGLPTRNFSQGQFSEAEKISGEFMRDQMLRRGGANETTHACMAGCTIRCSNVYAGEDGEEIVSPVEFETIGLMGSNLGIDSLDAIARLNWQVNDLGLDSIEVGAAIGVAAEAGLLEFGDWEKALALVDEIRSGSAVGKLLGNGAVAVGEAYSIERVPAVKGQALSAYDPRAIKGTGVTYATSPQGADHTSGLTIRAKIDHLDPDQQIAVSRAAQINSAGYDTLGACAFAGFGFAAAPGTIRDLLIARYGWSIAEPVLQDLGKKTLELEREFNRRAGFTSKDDRLPEWMTREKLPPHNSVFDVTEDNLDAVFDWS